MDQQENKPDYSLYNNSKQPTMAIYLKECSNHKSNYQLTIMYDQNVNRKEFRFGGHNILIDTWIENNLLNSIREIIIKKKVNNG